MTLLERADMVRPVDARIFARSNGLAMTSREIRKRSGMTLKTINKISKLTSWHNVPIGIADRFLLACGIDERNRWRVRQSIKRSALAGKGFRHIRRLINRKTATQNGHTARFFAGLIEACQGK